MLDGMTFGIALLSLLIAAAWIAGRTAYIRHASDRKPTDRCVHTT
jgi:Na+-transporting methylmalonyl-CoA/oxaloacetate decarboxylase gamma subunit